MSESQGFSIFSPLSSLPHGVCLTWDPMLVWTLAASHLLVGLAYFAIPFALFTFMRRQPGLRFNWMFALFGSFILACGITHCIALMNIWRPNYALEAVVMAFTAVVSVATAASLIPLIPIASRFLDEKKETEEKLVRMNHDLQDQMTRFFDLAIAQRASQAELMTVQDASPLGQFRTDAAGAVTYVNRSFELICGWPFEGVQGIAWTQIIHPEDLPRVAESWQHATRNETLFSSRHRFRKPDGSVVWVSAKGAPVRVDARVIGYVGSVDDVTALHLADQALKAKQQQLEVIADALPMEISYLDRELRIRFANRALETRLGQSRAMLDGKPLYELLDPGESQALRAPIAAALDGATINFEQLHTDLRTTQSTFIPAYDTEQAEIIGVHAMTQDISARKAEEARLRTLTITDSLTGLGNRAGFEAALKAALDRRARNPQHGGIAVLFLDLDHLKRINDTLGHAMGDALIQGFAERLRAGLRITDYCARLGGDEFTVVMEHIDSTDDVATVCAKLFAEMQQPFVVEGQQHALTASFGAACHLAPTPVDADTLVQKADAALYEAKHAGRNTYRVHLVS